MEQASPMENNATLPLDQPGEAGTGASALAIPRLVGWQLDLLYGIPVLLMAPLLYLEFFALWDRQYMRYFPIPIVVSLLMLFWARPTLEKSTAGRFVAAQLLWMAACLLIVSNWWIFSPWISHLCLILLFSGWMLERFELAPWPTLAAIGCFLATSMRLPGNVDNYLLNFLEGTAIAMSGLILDGFSVPYLHQSGVLMVRGLTETSVIEITVQQFTRFPLSMYAMVPLTMFWVMLRRRSMAASLLTLLTIPAWYTVFIVVQIMAIIIFAQHYHRDVNQGRDLILLTMSNFVVTMLGIVLTERFIAKMLIPVPAGDGEFEPEFQLINSMVCWPQPDPFHLPEEDALLPMLPPPATPSVRPVKVARYLRRVGYGLCLVAVLSGAATAYRGVAVARATRLLPNVTVALLEKIGTRESLPPVIADAELIDFQVIQKPIRGRARGVLEWQYAWQGQILQFSIMMPFRAGESSILDEYQRQGWRLIKNTPMSDEVAEGNPQSDSTEFQWTELQLENEFGGRATTVAALLPVQAPGGGVDSVVSDLFFHAQLFCESGEDLTRTQVRELRDIFKSICFKHLRQLDFRPLEEARK